MAKEQMVAVVSGLGLKDLLLLLVNQVVMVVEQLIHIVVIGNLIKVLVVVQLHLDRIGTSCPLFRLLFALHFIEFLQKLLICCGPFEDRCCQHLHNGPECGRFPLHYRLGQQHILVEA